MNIAELSYQQCVSSPPSLPSCVLIAVWILSLLFFISRTPDDMCNLLLMLRENVILSRGFPHVCFTDNWNIKLPFLCWYTYVVQEYTFHPNKGTHKAEFCKECMCLKINKDFRCRERVLPQYLSLLDIFYRKAWKLKQNMHAELCSLVISCRKTWTCSE